MMTTRKVRDVMQPSVISITPATPRAEIEQKMAERGIHHLPVLERGAIVGMISYGDLRRVLASDVPRLTVYEPSSDSWTAAARAMMSRSVVTVAATAPLTRAAWLMLKYKIAGLPVLRDGRLVGIVTASDILREVANSRDEDEQSQ